MQLGRGETIADTARVLSRYVDAIMIRILDHEALLELAEHATVPVINGLTRRSHPCQIMADVLTFEEHRGPIAGRKVAWSGDVNNVLASLVHAAQRFAFRLDVAAPPELQPPSELRAAGSRDNGAEGALPDRSRRRRSPTPTAVITDTWVSMGSEEARAPPQSADPLPGELPASGKGQARHHIHALPAGPPRRGGDGGRDRRAAVRRVRRGGEPPACPEGHPRLVSWSIVTASGFAARQERLRLRRTCSTNRRELFRSARNGTGVR